MIYKEMGPKPPRAIAHKDHYARVSYLYQLGQHFSSSGYGVLSQNFVRTADGVSKKAVLKLTPALKRTMCKKCHTLLVPGLSVTMYIENKSRDRRPKCDVLVHSCNACGTKKRFPVGREPEYEVFTERPGVAFDAA